MPQLHIRRATVEDLPALRSLWRTAKLPAEQLEARLRELQVVESGGNFAGAVGVEFVRQHGRFYAEDFADFSVADAGRELFWERIQTLAANHGVFRLWTQETSPFWARWGFQPATAEILQRLPDEWKSLEGRWLTLELKNEDAINAALENQLSCYADPDKKYAADLATKARKLKTFVIDTSFALGAIGFTIAIYLLMRTR